MAQKTWLTLIVVLVFGVLTSSHVMAENEDFPATGGLLPVGEITPDGFSEHAGRMAVPAYWNWTDVRGVNWMTSVKNQQGCGSCAAFAACGAVEAMLNIWSGNPNLGRDFSEQHLFSCAGGVCASGLYMGTAFDYFTNFGVPDEACFPYSSSDAPCADSCADWMDRVLQLDSWNLLWTWTPDIDALKQAVWWQPIPVYLEVYQDFSSYTQGIYKYDGVSSYRGGHFVVIVGWDDSNFCWICKNSWGSGWGESGYFRINYGETSIGTWAMDPNWNDPECEHTGDVDGNGMVSASDAQLVFQASLDIAVLSAHEACRGDCNVDDALTAGDAQAIFFKALGMGECGRTSR